MRNYKIICHELDLFPAINPDAKITIMLLYEDSTDIHALKDV